MQFRELPLFLSDHLKFSLAKPNIEISFNNLKARPTTFWMFFPSLDESECSPTPGVGPT